MKVEFGYGKGIQTVDIPDKNLDQVLVANDIAHERRGPDAVRYALENPIGSPRLKDLAKPGQKICIITSDISRPIPSFAVSLPSWMNFILQAAKRKTSMSFSRLDHTDRTQKKKRRSSSASVYTTK